MRPALLLFAASTLLAQLACAPLQKLPEGECGNGVVEGHEDCEPTSNEEYSCRPPGDALECTLVCKADGSCPPGFGCGADSVCRRPGGTFEPLPFLQAGSKASLLLAADFDADRRADVVAVEPGRARIHFIDVAGNLDQMTVTSPLTPAIGKLGNAVEIGGAALDATDDLVLPTELGIGALISQGDRSFKSRAYGSIPLDRRAFEINGQLVELSIVDAEPVAIDAIPSKVGAGPSEETAVLLDGALASDPDTLVTVFAKMGSAGGNMLFPLAETRASSLSGPPVTASFDQDPCEEVAFPAYGLKYLRVYKLCRKVDSVGVPFDWRLPATEEEATVAEIELGGEIIGPAFARDMNGDGHLDLAVSVLAPGPTEKLEVHLRVAYGDGAGHFGSVAGAPPDGKAADYARLPGDQPLIELAELHATAGGSGEAALDGITAGGVYRGHRETKPDGTVTGSFLSPAWHPAPRPWTDVVVSDINGDGRPDLLASSDGATDVDVLLNSPSGFWNLSQIATQGTVSQLVAGDFDGDLVPDVVFDEAFPASDSRISISYGRTFGGPEEARELARFDSVEHLIAGNVGTFGADGITDLGCTSTDSATRSFSFFPGSATRLMQAPLGLGEGSKNGANTPVAAAIGSLDEVPFPQVSGRRDLVVLASAGETDAEVGEGITITYSALRLWALFGGEEEADFTRARASHCDLPHTLYFPKLAPAHGIALSASPPDRSGLTVLAAPYVEEVDKNGLRSLLAAVTFDDVSCFVSRSLVSAPGELFFRVRTADLNTNGQPEILAIRRRYDLAQLSLALVNELGQSSNRPGQSGLSQLYPIESDLVVLWDAAFDAATTVPGLSGVRDFTVGEIDGDGNPDLMVLDDTGLHGFEAENGTQELVPLFGVGGTGGTISAGVSAEVVLLADVDGDGIQDLAMGGDSLQVYRGLSWYAAATRGSPEIL